MRINYTKRQAIELFGSRVKTAEAMGITPQAVTMLGKKLTRKKQDQIIGAAIRLGLTPVQVKGE